MRIVDLAKAFLRKKIGPSDWAIDATAGNGYDALFLKECIGENGKLWVFDIQVSALEKTRLRLEEARVSKGVEYIHAGHEHLLEKLPLSAQGKIKAVMFNLGYLPGGDKSLITHTETTLCALNQSLEVLNDEGVLSIILYPGHAGGAQEADAVLDWASQLPQGFTWKHKKPEAAGIKRSPELVLVFPPPKLRALTAPKKDSPQG